MQRTTLLRAAAAMRTLLTGECTLSYEADSMVALLSLTRPARRNAIGKEMLKGLQDTIAICADPAHSVRCLVVESRVDGIFCAGADLKERKSMDVDSARAFVDSLRQTFCDMEGLAIPTISAIEGKALGGGLELALATDLRVVGMNAKLGFPETGLGIIPGAGGTVRAPAVMGLCYALELIFTAEQVSAARANEMGLVNEVVPAGKATERALELARRIATNGPLAVAAAKQSVRTGYRLPTGEAMQCEHAAYEKVLASADRTEGLRAFAEKRSPVYTGK